MDKKQNDAAFSGTSSTSGSACPQCGSECGLKFPRNDDFYCEDCGFPDEDFSDEELADMKRIAWLERSKIGVSYNVATQAWETDFESGESFKTARQAIDAAMKPNRGNSGKISTYDNE